MRKRGVPNKGEFVVIKVTVVNPNSASVRLLEYNLEGMIHISEVASGWIRDIRKYLKPDQMHIAKVISVGERGMGLSMKNINQKQMTDKQKEYDLDNKAEKMLEMAATKLGKNLDQAYEEVGYALQEKFGSLFKAFETCLKKPESLEKRGVSTSWVTVIKEIAEKSIVQKEFLFRADLILKTFEPDGIERIKAVLQNIGKSTSVSYITAPSYRLAYKAKNAKIAESKFKELLENAVKDAKKVNIEASYNILK
ncbi:MAG: S1 RNA-binding domain-containing protein [Candidatus Aenigmatarchaeota archaeon]